MLALIPLTSMPAASKLLHGTLEALAAGWHQSKGRPPTLPRVHTAGLQLGLQQPTQIHSKIGQSSYSLG